jgi:biotin carboxylase
MRKTVLILGGGRMQLPAVQIARKNGWRVILADGNPDCLARPLADAFHHIDLVDREALAGMASAYRGRGELDGVFTAGTDFSRSVAFVAGRCGLPGIPFETATAASDKLVMRQALAAAGVPQPAFAGVTSAEEAAEAASRVGTPVVVKPVDNMGARGVRVVETADALAPAFEAAFAASRSRRVIVEEYMSGPELSLDAVVWQGRATVCGIADRHVTFAPYFVEMGHTMPSALDRGLLDDASAVFIRGIAALGIAAGAAKGDIKVTPRGAMVGEIAARLSGGYMSGWTFPYASGVEVTEAALRIAMGLDPGPLAPRVSLVSAERAFVSIPGRVAAVEGLAEACASPALRDLFLLVAPGAEVRLPTNNVQKCGNAISQAASRAAAATAAEEAVRAMFVRLAPANPATDAFLAEPAGLAGGLAKLAAFRLDRDENLRALHAMPVAVAGAGVPRVLPLPAAEREQAVDWHGLGFASAAQKALALAGATWGQGGGAVAGRLFWDALIKGGVQGAVYALETWRRRLGEAGAR